MYSAHLTSLLLRIAGIDEKKKEKKNKKRDKSGDDNDNINDNDDNDDDNDNEYNKKKHKSSKKSKANDDNTSKRSINSSNEKDDEKIVSIKSPIAPAINSLNGNSFINENKNLQLSFIRNDSINLLKIESIEEIKKKATILKHEADDIPQSIQQCVKYLASGILFLQQAALQEIKERSQQNQTSSSLSLLFSTTANLFDSCAKISESLKSEDYNWATVLSLKLSSISRFHAFSILANKLDAMYKQIQKNKDSQNYYNNHSYQCVLAVNSWKRAEDLRVTNGTESKIRCLPLFADFASGDIFSFIYDAKDILGIFYSDAFDLNELSSQNRSSMKKSTNGERPW